MNITQSNNDQIHESLNHIKETLKPKTTEKIDSTYSRNRIIFGAPGTGKSHKLEIESTSFKSQAQVKEDTKNLIKKEVTSARQLKNAKSVYNALGFKYSKELDIKYNEIERTYGKNTYEIYVGAKAAKLVSALELRKQKFEDDEDNDYTENVKTEIKSVNSSYEQNFNAIGYVYGDFISGFSLQEVIDTFGLDPKESKAYWLIRGAQASVVFCNETEQTIRFLERVTFHPNYSYAQFVGTYKPIQDPDNSENIKYSYVPGPFMRVYTNAVTHPKQNFLLLIEEINRANVASVFGDVFQLLDRYGENGDDEGLHAFESEYPVIVSEDMKKYLISKGVFSDELRIPENMYIWASMNSADQGVLPMDAAFKRRWDFEYLSIDEGETSKGFDEYILPIPHMTEDKKTIYSPIKWNIIRKAINAKLKTIAGINEDKFLGPYFISKSVLEKAKIITETGTDVEKANICSSFKSKVLMYLYEDVVKMSPGDLFGYFNSDKPIHYSDLCSKFDEIGLEIFDKDFIKE